MIGYAIHQHHISTSNKHNFYNMLLGKHCCLDNEHNLHTPFYAYWWPKRRTNIKNSEALYAVSASRYKIHIIINTVLPPSVKLLFVHMKHSFFEEVLKKNCFCMFFVGNDSGNNDDD